MMLNVGIGTNIDNPLLVAGWWLLFLVIIPYIYTFVKVRILRKYFDWEVGVYYPITEFLVIITGSVIGTWIVSFMSNLY